MKILRTICWPLIKIKEWTDPNYWASKVGESSGLYDKARNSKTRQWADSLVGWKWWAWQIGGGLLFVIVLEYLLNLIGMTMLPWRQQMKNDSIKIILSTFTALTGVGGSYWKMEDRVSKLEEQMAQQEKVRMIEYEIAHLKRDAELKDLEYRMKMDSIRFAHKKYLMDGK